MKFILIPIIVWILSQSIKFITRLIHNRKKGLNEAVWVYQWAGGAPSTHTAILTGSSYLVWYHYGLGPIFGFCFAASLLLIYNLLEDRKKQELEQKEWKKSHLKSIKNVFKDGKLLDISGHTYFEIITGFIFGLFITIILNNIL
jgi:acid phosphatase family membrane protein YuiD